MYSRQVFSVVIHTMLRATCFVLCLLVSLVHGQTSFGVRAPGDQLVYVKYLETESPVPADLLLHFKYDGAPLVSWISQVHCVDYTDNRRTHTAIAISGGVGSPGFNRFEHSLEWKEATYHRAECSYYGFYA